MAESKTVTSLDYQAAANAALKHLRRDRDRQIIAKRFGFGLAKKQTLERIGRDFNITRERVRQIEKAALIKLRTVAKADVAEANAQLVKYLDTQGGLAPIVSVAEAFGASDEGQAAYIVFLAQLAGDIEVIDGSDQLHPALGLLPAYTNKKVKDLSNELVKVITEVAKPTTLNKVANRLGQELSSETVTNLARITKALAHLDNKWGLISWPEVNPKSIRDKTYLVLVRQSRPLHFSDIATRIHELKPGREVTVQAVHNELIKDQRFVLIGRGIYALAEWGYSPGTVADIIAEILREESPLHKDEIVRRVLTKRQVKTTTIVLNLQEKDQFQRVAKATYVLREV
ncbi:MAG TPA: sigma factor-like helix-turn-helix DNA-binding protein [Candidatus Saccharimonadales bacterium]|nr:sigma factor-like helix-turn-helix DNA-binding protein [Candidatus Saccharimonadales bacterium]